jgi:GNAT superfamily N-acetyltransferase
VKFELLTTGDLPRVKELNPEDWPDITPLHIQYLNHEHCMPLKLMDHGKIIGLGTLILHGPTAWLAHIIVDPEKRGQGLGKLITQTLVDYAYNKACRSIYLIATTLGEPVYNSLGFKTETEYLFYKLPETASHISIFPEIIQYSPDWKNEIKAMDYRISGEHRTVEFENDLESTWLYIKYGRLGGYYISNWREGFIGAENKDAGTQLMQMRLQSNAISIFPKNNTTAVDYMEQLNLLPFRSAKRMFLGHPLVWKESEVYQRVGGNLG